MRSRFVALAALGAFAAASAPAQAQSFDQIGKGGKPANPPAPIAPPPALPGAKPGGGGAAPVTRVPADMEPNEALFDAINRGDIASARDALSRGADLHAHNILGMTPLELSIDLGRNDISFMLLSMRAADETHSSQTRRATASKLEPKQPVRQARRTPATTIARAPAPAPTQTARLFSGDGGTPNPNAGFLGFDPNHR
jgi:hypothetical protein